MPACFIDHLVISAPSLDAGKKMLHDALGVWPQAGGEHDRMGTHNALLRLGPKLYLEVIAINNNAPSPSRPRWFALDSRTADRSPALTTWVVRCDEIHAAHSRCDASHGEIEPMSRGDLQWAITIPHDGGLPFHGVAPTLIQWRTAEHPASRLEDRGCELLWLQGFHPQADRINALLAKLGFADQISIVPHHEPRLVAQIKTPYGQRELKTDAM
jgi:Glyoxalase-like domain